MKNLREMDKLYQENSRHKAEAEQLKEQNKQLEQGLKEVIENLKKYTPGEVPLTLWEVKNKARSSGTYNQLKVKDQKVYYKINAENLIIVGKIFALKSSYLISKLVLT